MTILKQLPLNEYAQMIQWVLKYAKNAKVWLLSYIVESLLMEHVDVGLVLITYLDLFCWLL